MSYALIGKLAAVKMAALFRVRSLLGVALVFLPTIFSRRRSADFIEAGLITPSVVVAPILDPVDPAPSYF